MSYVSPLVASSNGVPTRMSVADAVYPGAQSTVVADYTLNTSNIPNGIGYSGSTGVTITIPTNATFAYAANTLIPLRQMGTGAITVVGAAGVTLNAPFGASTSAKGDMRVIEYVALDVWNCY